MDRFLLVLTLAVAPVLLFPLKFQFPLVAVTVPLLWLVRWPISGRLLPATPLNLPLAILGLSVLLSVFSTPDLHVSLQKLAGTVLGFLLFFVLVDFLSGENRLRVAVLVFAACGSLLALLSLVITRWKPLGPLGTIGQTLFPPRFSIPGFDGGFNPNPIGGSLSLFLPVLLMLCILSLRKTDLGVPGPQTLYYLFFRISLVVVAFVLLLSQSRSSWIAVLVSLTFLFFSLKLLPRSQRVWRATLGVLFLLVVVGGTMLVFVASVVLPGDATVESEFSRQEVWTRAIWGIQDFPVTGLGLNAFRGVVGRIFPFYRLVPGADVASAHNQFLQAAVDLGIPAMIMYGAIWFVSFRMLFLLVRSSRTPLFRDLAVGLGAGLIGHFTFQLTDAVPLGAKLGIFWWFAIALITSMYCLEFNRGSGAEKKSRIRSPVLFWTTGSLVSVALVSQFPSPALMIALTASIAVGFATVTEPERKNTNGSRGAQAEILTFSPRLIGIAVCAALSLLALPGFSSAVRVNSVALYSLRHPEKVIAGERIEEVEKVELLRTLGNAHWQLGNNSEAARLFNKCLLAGSKRPMTVFKAILASARTGDVKKAGRTLEDYGFPMNRLASFAYNANIGQDQVNAIVSANVILASERPDGDSLCAAKKIYGSLSLLDSVRPSFMGQIEQLDRSKPLDDPCSIELGWLGFENGDLPLAHSFWDPVLAREPGDQPLSVRAKSCYVTYRLTSYHSKLGNAEATESYREKGRKWCAQVGTWYSRSMVPDHAEQPD